MELRADLATMLAAQPASWLADLQFAAPQAEWMVTAGNDWSQWTARIGELGSGPDPGLDPAPGPVPEVVQTRTRSLGYRGCSRPTSR